MSQTLNIRRIAVCLLCLPLVAAIGCDGKSKKTFFTMPCGVYGGAIGSAMNVRCIDAVTGSTMSGVTCTLAGGESKVTDGSGTVTFKNISGSQTVTLAKGRYVTTTYYHVNAKWLVARLEPVDETGYDTGTVSLTVLGIDSAKGDYSGIVRSRGKVVASFDIFGTTTAPSTLVFPVVAGRKTPIEVAVHDSPGNVRKSGKKMLWTPYAGAQNVTITVKTPDQWSSVRLVTGTIDNSAITKFTPDFGFSGSQAEIAYHTTIRHSNGAFELGNGTFSVYVQPSWSSLSQSVRAGVGDNEGNLTYCQFNGNFFSVTGSPLSGTVKNIPEITSNLVNLEPNGSITWDGVVNTGRYLLEMTEQGTGAKWLAVVPGGTTTVDIPNEAGILALRNYTANIASETYSKYNYNDHYTWRLPTRLTHRSETAAKNVTTSGGGSRGGPITGDITVTVTNEFTRLPLEGVVVYVDSILMVHTTNSSGIAVVDSVSGPQTVTLCKAGYEGLTLFDIDATEITFPLTPLDVGGVPLTNFEINLTELDCTSDAYSLYLSDMYATAGLILSGRPSPDDPILIDWPAETLSHPAVLVYDNLTAGPSRYGYTILPATTPGTVAVNIVPKEIWTYGPGFQTLLGSFDVSLVNGFVPTQGTVEAFGVLPDCSSVFTGAADYFLGNGFYDGGIFNIPEAGAYRLEASVENAAGQFSASYVRGSFSDFAGLPVDITLNDVPSANSSFATPPMEMPISWKEVPGASYYAIAIDGPGFFWYGLVPGGTTSVTLPVEAGLIPEVDFGCSIEAHTIDNFDYNQFTPLSVRNNRTNLSIWVLGGTFQIEP